MVGRRETAIQKNLDTYGWFVGDENLRYQLQVLAKAEEEDTEKKKVSLLVGYFRRRRQEDNERWPARGRQFMPGGMTKP